MIALVSLKSLLLYYCKQLIQALGPLTGKDGPIQFFQINTILSMMLMFFCNIDIDIDTVIVVCGSEKSWSCCFVCPYILMML